MEAMTPLPLPTGALSTEANSIVNPGLIEPGYESPPEFINPSDTPEHDPTKVRRSKDGRPYVKHLCPAGLDFDAQPGDLCVDGRVTGKTAKGKQCPKCKGKGYIEKLYTRCTSFVGVLDDRSNLEKWKLRIVLTGLGVDHDLLMALDAADPDDREELDAIAEEAFMIGEGHAKAQKGTNLHYLSEFVDKNEPLPEQLYNEDAEKWEPVTLQDRADMAAWKRTLDELGVMILDSERFVVNDEYQIGGTYDRLVDFTESDPCELCKIPRPKILDLKTGRVDYGAGKIAQQLAVYAHSDDYDPETGTRTKQDVCQHVGIVIHLPQGTGEATVLLADLVQGWEAVGLSAKVREFRRTEKNLLTPLETS